MKFMPRLYCRGTEVLTLKMIEEIAPYLSHEMRKNRVLQWESGKLDCDELFKPCRAYQTTKGFIDCSDLGPRREPDSIKITPFEREMGRRAEERWMREVTRAPRR